VQWETFEKSVALFEFPVKFVVYRDGPWRWRQQCLPKRWYPTATLHGVTNRKTSTWSPKL